MTEDLDALVMQDISHISTVLGERQRPWITMRRKKRGLLCQSVESLAEGPEYAESSESCMNVVGPECDTNNPCTCDYENVDNTCNTEPEGSDNSCGEHSLDICTNSQDQQNCVMTNYDGTSNCGF